MWGAKMKSAVCRVLLIALIIICAKTDNNYLILTSNTVENEAKPIIILDAGHGGFDGGAVHGTIVEKDINLQFALLLEPMLKAFGYEVIMTRTTDTGTEDSGLSTIRSKKVSDINNRLNLIESTDIECFISLHQNMFSQSKYRGTQVFYGASHPESEIYAECVQSAVKSLLQNDNNRTIKQCGKNIYLMYKTTKPAVLIECGFMSNSEELDLLLNENYRKKLNFCILSGILNGRKTIKNG